MFGVYRLGAAVPVPGVDLEAVQRLTESGTQAGIYGLLNLSTIIFLLNNN